MTTDTTALLERVAGELYYDQHPEGRHRSEWPTAVYPDIAHEYRDLAAAVLPIIAEQVRKAQAEAWEAWTSGLATHLDGATPRAWGFHHPCDPPGERWEPSVKDRTLMEVSDFLRDREANPNPYHTTEKESRHDDER